MRFLREALLSLFVVVVVLCLYFLAAGVALFSFWGFVSHRDEPDAAYRSAIAKSKKSYRSAAISYNHLAKW
jgi:hypothetical protein